MKGGREEGGKVGRGVVGKGDEEEGRQGDALVEQTLPARLPRLRTLLLHLRNLCFLCLLSLLGLQTRAGTRA